MSKRTKLIVRITGTSKQVTQALNELLSGVQYDKIMVNISTFQDGREIATLNNLDKKS